MPATRTRAAEACTPLRGRWRVGRGRGGGVDIRGGGDVPGVSAGPPGLDGVSPAWTMARRVSHEGGRRAPRRPADGTARPDPSPNPAGAGRRGPLYSPSAPTARTLRHGAARGRFQRR